MIPGVLWWVRGASDIHFRIGIIARITAWLYPALQESITFPVAVSSAGVSIAQTQCWGRWDQLSMWGWRRRKWVDVLHARYRFKIFIKNLNLTGNRFKKLLQPREKQHRLDLLGFYTHPSRRKARLGFKWWKEETRVPGSLRSFSGIAAKAFKVYHMITVHLALCAFTTFSLREKNDSATGGCRESPF